MMTKDNTNDNVLAQMRHNLGFLNTSQLSIEKTSHTILNLLKGEKDNIKYFIQEWEIFCLNKVDYLPYIYLANDIIQKLFFSHSEIYEILFKNVLTSLKHLFQKSMVEKAKESIFKIIDIWIDRGLTLDKEKEKLIEFKKGLELSYELHKHNSESKVLRKFYKKRGRKFHLDKNIVSLAHNFKNLQNKNKAYLKLTRKDDKLFKEELRKEENQVRGIILRTLGELIKKQKIVYSRHVFYTQEIDKLLEKIENTKDQINNNLIV
jgi:hypothetical protein